MHRSTRRCRQALVLALGATLLLAGPAGAHPFVAGGEAPVDSLASLRLTMAHGCGTEDSGGGDPTLEVAMQVADDMRIVEVPDVDGYEVALERAADGSVEVVTWTATGDGVAAPELPFDAVVTGEPGTGLYLKVFQGCEGFAYRWVGTPDDPAEDPAVAVELVAADPDSPAPPPDAGVAAETGDDAPDGEDHGTSDDGDATGNDTGSSGDDPSTEDAPATDGDGDATADADDVQAAADPPDGGPGTAILVGVVLLALVVGGVLVGRRVRGATREGDADA